MELGLRSVAMGSVSVCNSFDNHFALELGNDGESLELKFGKRTAIKVQVAADHHQLDGDCLEKHPDRSPIGQVSGESIETMDDDAIDFSFADSIEKFDEARAIERFAA